MEEVIKNFLANLNDSDDVFHMISQLENLASDALDLKQELEKFAEEHLFNDPARNAIIDA